MTKHPLKVRMIAQLRLSQPCRIEVDDVYLVDHSEKVKDRGQMDRPSVLRLLEYRNETRKSNQRYSLERLKKTS